MVKRWIALSVIAFIGMFVVIGIDACERKRVMVSYAEMNSAMICETITEKVGEKVNGNLLKDVEPIGKDEISKLLYTIPYRMEMIKKETAAEPVVSEVLEETVEETTVATEAETQIEVVIEEIVPLYSVNGAVLEPELQKFVWRKMNDFGLQTEEREMLFPLWLAEIYQESGFNTSAYFTGNGNDFGLCQLRETYHDYFKEISGLPKDADLKTDVFSNLYAGTYLYVSNYLKTWDLDKTIALYMNGGDEANARYIYDVRKWFPTIERIN